MEPPRKRQRCVEVQRCIVVEPFYGGSHRQLVDLLVQHLNTAAGEGVVGGRALDVYTLPDRKWHWRMLVSAVHFAQTIPTA